MERNSFPHIAPERVGVTSDAVERFVDRLERAGLTMHGFLMLKHGQVFAEGYWKPFGLDSLHRMYSVSKSFVSLAVGIMIGEGRLSLHDHIVDFFPEKLPEPPHPFVAAMTVRDLLRMATPHDENAYTQHDADWVSAFLNKAPSHLPGTVFHYDTAGTVTLTAIVEKISGVTLMEYLRPRLLDPIGVSKDAWCVERPDGGHWGGSGVICTARDLAKVALLCLNQGQHEGRQLVPAEYVRAATSYEIDNRTSSGEPEMQFGYGYQFWRLRNNGFAMLGMGGQMAVFLPDSDFLLITIADTQGVTSDYSVILNSLWTEIYPHLERESLAEDEVAHAALIKRLGALSISAEAGHMTSPLTESMGGRKFLMGENPMGITSLRLMFRDDEGSMLYENAQGMCELRFGFGHNVHQLFPQKNYYARRIGATPGKQYECLCSAAWADDENLIVRVRIVDWYLGSIKMHICLSGGSATVQMCKTAEWFLEEYQGMASSVFADGF